MQDFRPTLLHHILALAPFDGWSHYTFREAAHLAGLKEETARHAFGGGIEQAARYYFSQLDDTVLAQIPPGQLAALRVPERIELLIMTRLQCMTPHREAVRRVTSAFLLPWNAGYGLKGIYAMTERMWRAAGDRSTDFNFYTKRLTLAGVYTSTFLFWLEDTSTDLSATRDFLRRRLRDVAEFGKKKKGLLSTFQRFSTYAKRTS